MNQIPFTLPEVGLREIKGVVYLDGGYLVIKIHDALLGFTDVEKNTIKIEPAAIDELRLKKGLFVDKLIVSPRKPDLLVIIPGDHPWNVKLRIWRTHRREVEELINDFFHLPASVDEE